MKLELKHLAPYLPYELEVQVSRWSYTFGQTQTHNIVLNTEIIRLFQENYYNSVLPILQPIINYNSHSFNNCFSYDEKAECFISNNGEIIIEFSNIDLPYWFIQLLFEHHFDVFGLIEKGLAIDKNTLSK